MRDGMINILQLTVTVFISEIPRDLGSQDDIKYTIDNIRTKKLARNMKNISQIKLYELQYFHKRKDTKLI